MVGKAPRRIVIRIQVVDDLYASAACRNGCRQRSLQFPDSPLRASVFRRRISSSAVMQISRRHSAFALAVTLVMMALIAIVIVAYLANTRTDRSTSSVYANQLKAKMMADSGLAAATKLLRDNTRYGNYITAMPAPSPSPAPLYTEIYRPTNPLNTIAAKADDYLRLDNAGGEVSVSRAIASASPGPDRRPTPELVPTPLPTSSPFALSIPNLSGTNSYNFNQLITIGGTTGRLVQPSPSPIAPAYGQWVTVRNNASSPEVIGRYAFYIEDESMKVNVNYVGNNVGASNMRVNDLVSPIPVSTPASQIQAIDPSAILPTSANRSAADTSLTTLGASGGRLPSRLTSGLLLIGTVRFPITLILRRFSPKMTTRLLAVGSDWT